MIEQVGISGEAGAVVEQRIVAYPPNGGELTGVRSRLAADGRPRGLLAGLMFDRIAPLHIESRLPRGRARYGRTAGIDRQAARRDAAFIVIRVLAGDFNAHDLAQRLSLWCPRGNASTYFARMQLPGKSEKRWPLKIGTTNSVAERIAGLHGAGPYPVRLVASVPGVLLDEKPLHEAFARYRMRGEWFREEGRLKRLVSEVEAFIEVQRGAWPNR